MNIPKYLRAFLLTLTPAQKDEIWLWADSGSAAEEIIELVGVPDGTPNVEL